jgi:peptidoglycan-associated lipoprotein
MRALTGYVTCALLACFGVTACSHQQSALGAASTPATPAARASAAPPPEPRATTAPVAVAPPAMGQEAIYFAVDDALVQGDSSAVLGEVGRRLLANPRARVRIEGNCDERGTTQYNIVLGEARARAARDYLLRLGIAPGRIEIVSFGSERPRRQGHDESAWAQNRRDDFVVR